MDETDEKALGPGARGGFPDERTPRELLRFRRRIVEGCYDRLDVAEALARRLLARGHLDPPPAWPVRRPET